MSVRSSLFVMSSMTLALAAQALGTPPVTAAPPGIPTAGAAHAALTWEPTVAVDSRTRGSSFVVDAHSNATIVWETRSGAVMSVRRSAAGNWSKPDLVGESGAAMGSPRVASDAQGNLTAVWVTQREGFTDGIMAARRRVGSGWSRPVRLSDDRAVPTYPGDGKGAWGADQVELAVSPKGATVVVWDWGSDDRNKPWRIQSVYRAPGGAWGHVVAVTPARGNRDPQVGMAADGTAVLLYTRQPQGHPQSLLSKRRHVGAGWTRATTVAARGYVPTLTVDRAGDAVVVFMPTVNRVMAAFRHRGSHWGAPRRLTPEGARLVGVCAAAMNGSGSTLVVWVDRHGRVDLVRRPPGGPWSAPTRVVGTTDLVSHVAVGLNRAGDSFLAWGEYALAGVYRPHGGRWSSRATLSFGDGVEVLEGVRATVAPNGDAIVLWEQEGMPLRVRVGSTS